MKIGTYISELLFEHETVLLPGFGEFSTKYIPARFIPEEKKIESPKKVITFNADRKEGDTPLVAHIAGKELMELHKVKEYLDNFVREIRDTLSSGQKVQLERVGIFNHDADGNLAFEPDQGINYLADAAGLGTISEPPRVAVAPEVPPAEEPEPTPPAVSPKEPPVEEIKQETAPEPVEATPEAPKEEPGEAAPVYTAAAATARPDLPKSIKWLAWVIIPFLVILIILVFNWRFIFGGKSESPAPVAQTEQAAPAAQTPAAPETETTEPATTQETVAQETPAARPQAAQTPAQPTPGQKTYFIVVGAFQEEAQANSLVNELREKGASQAQIFMTTNTGYHRVCYAFYSDLSEAEAMLPRVQQEVNPNAWILHRN